MQQSKGFVISLPRIIVGGWTKQICRMTKAENYLVGKTLTDPQTFNTALNMILTQYQPGKK